MTLRCSGDNVTDAITTRKNIAAFHRPEVLISIPNVAGYPQPSCLLRMDVGNQRGQWIDLGFDQLVASGLGICGDDKYLYHVYLASPDLSTHLTILDRSSLRVASVTPLLEVSDVHSIVRLDDELIVASTGTDQILAYRINGAELDTCRQVWSPTDSGADTHHINSLVVADGRLLCSAFGPKENHSWTSVRNGYIRDLTQDSIIVGGLRQPHSATWHDGQLFFCNSLEGSVNTSDDVIAFLYGYSRGLSFGCDGTLYVGTSLSRRPPEPSDDTGVFRNPGDPGELHGQCALIEMTERGTNRLEMPMAPHGVEIYDILTL
jgi:Domain of unknown function (DUF4915)